MDHGYSDAPAGRPDALVFVLDHIRRGTRLVRLLGHVDEQSAADILAMISTDRSQGTDLLILDLSELSTLAAEAVHVLVRIAVEVGQVSIGLCLVVTNEAVEAALERAGVRYLFELHGTVEEAIGAS